MKKIFYILLISLALPLLGLAQKDSIVINKNTPSFNNQLDVNAELLGVAFGYKKRIYGNFFASVKIGAGATAIRVHYKKNNYSDTKIESFSASLLSHYSFGNLVSIELGPRYSSIYYELGQPNSTRFEWELGLYTRVKKIHFGIRFGLLGNDSRFSIFKEKGEKYSNSFLIIRIPLKKW